MEAPPLLIVYVLAIISYQFTPLFGEENWNLRSGEVFMKKNHSASLAFEENHLHLVNYPT